MRIYRVFKAQADRTFILQSEFPAKELRHSYSLALIRKRTIPTERPPLVVEVSANLCG
jgi:hypothetical protein